MKILKGDLKSPTQNLQIVNPQELDLLVQICNLGLGSWRFIIAFHENFKGRLKISNSKPADYNRVYELMRELNKSAGAR